MSSMLIDIVELASDRCVANLNPSTSSFIPIQSPFHVTLHHTHINPTDPPAAAELTVAGRQHRAIMDPYPPT